MQPDPYRFSSYNGGTSNLDRMAALSKNCIFEVSWEVCNMVGGVHTSLASKSRSFVAGYGQNYLTFGPSHWQSEARGFEQGNWDEGLVAAMAAQGIPIRCGYWQVPGRPRCVLVDFSQLYKAKDEILEWMWREFEVDSLTGAWDYIEPVLFSHAAARIIQTISQRSQQGQDSWTVLFHEWMGAAGLLYLKREVPNLASVFITHATCLGRAAAAAGQGSNAILKEANPLIRARHLGILAKHTLECALARNADCFATVSEPAAREAESFLGRKPDFLLFNALDESFPEQSFAADSSRKAAREALLQLGRCITGINLTAETKLLGMAARYEFVNKGVNLALDALGDLNRRESLQHNLLAFFFLPTENRGPDPAIRRCIEEQTCLVARQWSSHLLAHPDADPFLVQAGQLQFSPSGKVHPVLVPIYLDGKDPLLPFHYYALLAACDLTLFPSLYEPWGYTPLESLALGVPTISTDLAGIGQWVSSLGETNGCTVLRRAGSSYEGARNELAGHLLKFCRLTTAERQEWAQAARTLAEKARWREHVDAYQNAIQHAQMVKNRQPGRFDSRLSKGFAQRLLHKELPQLTTINADQPRLFPYSVHNRLPESLRALRSLAYNLWWCWNNEAEALYEEVDPSAWESCGHNPIRLLDVVQQNRLDELALDAFFLTRLEELEVKLDRYLQDRASEPRFAYFCMEFGIHECLPIYSGGLGILAGDHLKAASDLKISMVALGLAYRGGYFRQTLDHYGQQQNAPFLLDFSNLPITPVDKDGTRLVLGLRFPGRQVFFQVWRVQVGSVPLFLMDTDLPQNSAADRELTRNLYGGDHERRLQQEFVLGIGGRQVLDALGLGIQVYHMNEGHAAFLILSRIYDKVSHHQLDFETALEYVRRTCVFTTHTPVAAGHDTFSEDSLRPYFSPYVELLHHEWSELMGLGRYPQHHRAEDPFSMTLLGLRGARYVNGVSRIHAEVSKQNFHPVLPGFLASEIPVRAITNGVHVRTWLAPAFVDLFRKELGEDWENRSSEQALAQRVRGISQEQLESIHQGLKTELLEEMRRRIERDYRARHDSPRLMNKIINGINDSALLIGFARRFAPYKRATLLFSDRKALERILLQSDRPVLFLFAGKAHPADKQGQALIKTIFELTRERVFHGRILLLEDYDMALAKLLVRGCDVWLNTPTRPLEASGTSGMKAAMNGVLNLSVPDGWWAEGFNGANGWSLGGEQLYEKQELQDEFDSQHLYFLLRTKVIPLFHPAPGKDRHTWFNMMRESMASTLFPFSARRMMQEYRDHFYQPALEQANTHEANDYAEVRRMGRCKAEMRKAWPSLRIESIHMTQLEHDRILTGTEVDIRAEIHHPDIQVDWLCLEFVYGERNAQGSLDPFERIRLHCVERKEQGSIWQGSYLPQTSGSLSFGIRVRPRVDLQHEEVEMDLDLVRWA